MTGWRATTCYHRCSPVASAPSTATMSRPGGPRSSAARPIHGRTRRLRADAEQTPRPGDHRRAAFSVRVADEPSGRRRRVARRSRVSISAGGLPGVGDENRALELAAGRRGRRARARAPMGMGRGTAFPPVPVRCSTPWAAWTFRAVHAVLHRSTRRHGCQVVTTRRLECCLGGVPVVLNTASGVGPTGRRAWRCRPTVLAPVRCCVPVPTDSAR